MYLLKLPISKSEAWRLYNQNRQVVMVKAWSDESTPIPAGKGYDEFDGQFFAIPLSEEESVPFWNLYKKFAWIIAGAAVTGPMGLILAALSFLASHSSNLDERYKLYGLIAFGLLSFCSFCVYLMIQQARQETKLWYQLFDKYQVSDWKKTWR